MCDELNLSIEKLYERAKKGSDVIGEIKIQPQTIYCRQYISTDVVQKTNLLRDTAIEALRKHGIDISRRMFFTQYSTDNPDCISYCVAVPPDSEGEYIVKLPSLRGISFFHHGAYEDIPKTRSRMFLYAKENSIKLSGICRNIYLEGPPQHKDKSKFITQIILLIDHYLPNDRLAEN